MMTSYEIDLEWTEDEWLDASSMAYQIELNKTRTKEEQEYMDFCKFARNMFDQGTLERVNGQKIVPVKTERDYKNYIMYNRKKMNITTIR